MMDPERARDKLAILTAFNILNGRFPEIISSVGRSIERAEFTAEEFVGFIGEAASEMAGCSRRRVPIELRRSGQEFPQVAAELNDAMQEKEFDWAHLVAFLHEVHRILNQLRASERTSQQTEGEKVMEKESQVMEISAGLNPRMDWEDEAEGRKLSAKAVAFREWVVERFDEEAFLRKYRLISPEAETVNA